MSSWLTMLGQVDKTFQKSLKTNTGLTTLMSESENQHLIFFILSLTHLLRFSISFHILQSSSRLSDDFPLTLAKLETVTSDFVLELSVKPVMTRNPPEAVISGTFHS